MSKKPNMIFVFADQLRYDSLGCNGNRFVDSPYIDRLAREGVAFDQAFSSCPICSPYRGQLVTGRYSHANGVMCNEYRLFDNQQTIAGLFGGAGYSTTYVGKWHLGYGPYPDHKRYGFDDMYAYNCIHDYYNVSYWHNERGPFPMVDYAPNIETDIAIRSIRRSAEESPERPFCLLMSWGPPHWNGPAKRRRYGEYPQEFDRYRDRQLEVPDNVPRQMRAFAREELADYYGMITSLDHCFGRLMAELERLGIAEDTVLCFSSDHGDHLSSHGYVTPSDSWMHHSKRASKATPFEESIHVPLIIRYPRLSPGGRRARDLVSSVDLLPTLLDLAGISIPAELQGQSFAGAMRGEPYAARDSVFLQNLGTGWPNRPEWVGFWRGVRTDRYLYARWKNRAGTRLLFDLDRDPWEMRNLVDEADSGTTLEEMEARLQQWLKTTGDPFDSGKRLPVTGMLDLGQAFISARWHTRAPTEYVAAIETNHHSFRTGEQPGEEFLEP